MLDAAQDANALVGIEQFLAPLAGQVVQVRADGGDALQYGAQVLPGDVRRDVGVRRELEQRVGSVRSSQVALAGEPVKAATWLSSASKVCSPSLLVVTMW